MERRGYSETAIFIACLFLRVTALFVVGFTLKLLGNLID